MGLIDSILSDPISRLTLRPQMGVSPNATVREVCDVMRAEHVGCAIVLDPHSKPLGMFNEKMLVRLLATNPAGVDEPVKLHMTTNIVTIGIRDPVAKLVSIMQEHKLRWVCVVDEEGRAVAITGLRGLLEYVVDVFPHLVKVQPYEERLAMKSREGA